MVEFMPQLMPGADADLVKPLADRLKKQGVAIHLKTKVVEAKAQKSGIACTFEGESIPEGTLFDRVLVAVGRSANGGKLDADKAGVRVGERGFIPVDAQMRTNVPHIFAIGDLVGQPMLAHKATPRGQAGRGSGRRREEGMGGAGDPVGGLHRSGNRVGRRDRNRGEGQGAEGRRRQVPVGGVGPRDRLVAHRRLHQAAVRRGHPPRDRWRHRRRARR